MYEQPPNSRNATKFSGDTSFYLVHGSENFSIPYVTHNRCFRFCESRKLVVFSEFVGGCQKIRFSVVEKIRRTKYRCDRLLCTDFGVYVKSEQFFTRTWRVQQTRNKQTSPPTPPIVVETIRSESENIEIGWDKYDLKAFQGPRTHHCWIGFLTKQKTYRNAVKPTYRCSQKYSVRRKSQFHARRTYI